MALRGRLFLFVGYAVLLIPHADPVYSGFSIERETNEPPNPRYRARPSFD